MAKFSGKSISKSFLTNIFQKSPARMVIVNPENGVTINANHSYLDFYGYTRKQVIGKTAVELGHMENTELRKMMNHMRNTECADSILVKVKDKNSASRHILLNFIPVIVNKKRLFLSFGTDISSSVRNVKNIQSHILDIFDSYNDGGVILVNTDKIGNISLTYANRKATAFLKKYSLIKLMHHLEQKRMASLKVGSDFYSVRITGLPDTAGTRMIILHKFPSKINYEQFLENFKFTPRQRDVILLAVAGHSNTQIAKKLRLSEFTVKDHFKDIYRIVGISSRSELFPKLLRMR
jgi:PAS domain S-box-containing protein